MEINKEWVKQFENLSLRETIIVYGGIFAIILMMALMFYKLITLL